MNNPQKIKELLEQNTGKYVKREELARITGEYPRNIINRLKKAWYSIDTKREWGNNKVTSIRFNGKAKKNAPVVRDLKTNTETIQSKDSTRSIAKANILQRIINWIKND